MHSTTLACAAGRQAKVPEFVDHRSSDQQPELPLLEQPVDRCTKSDTDHAGSGEASGNDGICAEGTLAEGTLAEGSCAEGQQNQQAVLVALVAEQNHVHLLLSPSQQLMSSSPQISKAPQLASDQLVSRPSQTRDMSDPLGLPETSIPSVSGLDQAVMFTKRDIEAPTGPARMSGQMPARAQASAIFHHCVDYLCCCSHRHTPHHQTC